MKTGLLGEPRVILQNPDSRHNYFAWPSVTRLKDGRIAVACSGFRLRHICPFGKAVIAYSADEGETYTPPAPVIDTPLDDRDAGLCAFGKSGLILTSFNNTAAFQRQSGMKTPYADAYLDTVTAEDENRFLGSTFRVSTDNGTTFGALFRSPITSPHGPLELQDGRLLWVGRTYTPNDSFSPALDSVQAWEVRPNGVMTYRGKIENICDEFGALLSCEPHTVQLPSGRLLCLIRVQRGGEHRVFTVYQSVSDDLGRTWSKPRQLLERLGGSPAHVLLHSSGKLIATYGYRERPFGIRVMVSSDGGENWQTDLPLYENPYSADLGYPESVELADGSLITVFYAHSKEYGPAVIVQQKWRLED